MRIVRVKRHALGGVPEICDTQYKEKFIFIQKL